MAISNRRCDRPMRLARNKIILRARKMGSTTFEDRFRLPFVELPHLVARESLRLDDVRVRPHFLTRRDRECSLMFDKNKGTLPHLHTGVVKVYGYSALNR